MKKPSKIKNCINSNCGVDITHLHGRAVRCEDCSKVHRNEYLRMYMARKYLKDREKKFEMYSKEDLLLIGDDHMPGAGTFVLPAFSGDFEEEMRVIAGLRKYQGL